MSREEQEWASSKCPTEGSILPCGKIRCAFFKTYHCHEWGVDRSGCSVKGAKRDKETEPELSHTNGGRTVSNMERGRSRYQTASRCLTAFCLVC